MTYSKFLTLGTIAAGMVFAGTAAQAQDRYSNRYADSYSDRQHLNRDYARVERLRAQIANDRYRLEEDRRRGRRWAAERDARDLARHQYELDRQLRDIRHDRAEMYWDRR
jgi:hypothetical protein